MYGPLWITTTLVVLITIFSKSAAALDQWLAVLNKPELALQPSMQMDSFDLSKLSRCFTIMFTFLFIIPLVLYYCFKTGSRLVNIGELPGSKAAFGVRYLELVSLYGYSFTPFIVSTVLSGLPLYFLRLFSLIGATICSLMFLEKELQPMCIKCFSNDEKYRARMLVLGTHSFLFLLLRYYFF